MIHRRTLATALFLLLAAPAATTALDTSLLAGMKARSIGPAGMSGRVASVEAVASDPRIIYVGAATGGLWKSINAGLTWEPIFDDQPVAAIGAVSVFQPSPDIVWVGTGEGNTRNSVSVGNGIYRSLDGGRTWTHLGLAESERIHRILLHPTDPDTAYVAVVGRLWGDGRQRGVFRTTDGGATWEKILYVNERTGAADLAMNPSNPRHLIAAMWEHRRWPWFFESGGAGSGLHVTHDGGKTWKQLTPEDGLPEGHLGRVGLAFAPSDPAIVYALVEAEDLALYRSRDGGASWEKRPARDQHGNRPFYYADIRVDPERPDRVYSLWSLISVTEDGGESFRTIAPFRAVHPDHHAMWINPDDPTHILAGNDGGVVISRDRGETWQFVANLPLAQYYHVRVDDEVPYNIYGGMQDNGSWRGPSRVWENGGIRNHHWEEVGFGDGFDTVPLPADSRSGYAMSQEGFLIRWNLATGERRDIRPPAPDGETLRFNWNAAIALDPFVDGTLYYGSQFVHRSRDRGLTWEILSGDLTTNNPQWQKQAESGGLTLDVTGAENFTSIVALAPSPVQQGVLWAGTDDGRLHVTRDGGATWTSLESRLRRVPENTWIPHIEPSPHDAATAFVVLDNHRRSDWTPYVYRTTDFGRTWTSLATDNLWGYALVIKQDPRDPELLFLGTEFGLWVSLSGGRDWFRWTHGVPTVSVMDMALQEREDDLVLGTHGRAAFVLDDINPLRSLSAPLLARPLHLFEIPDAIQYEVKQTGASRFPGHGEFRGENAPYGALITFSANQKDLPHPDDDLERARKAALRAAKDAAGPAADVEPADEEPAHEGAGQEAGEDEDPDEPGAGGRSKDGKGKAIITVVDGQGRQVNRLERDVHLGVNRITWNLRHEGFRQPPRDEPGFFTPRGPRVVPGTYTIRVKVGDHEAEGPVRVLEDPRFQVSTEERRAKLEAILAAGSLQETVVEGIRRLRMTGREIELVLARIAFMEEAAHIRKGDPSPWKDLKADAGKLKKELAGMEKRFWVPPETAGIPAETDALTRVRYAQRNLGSSRDAPTPAQHHYLSVAGSLVDEVLAAFNALYDDRVAGFRRQVKDGGIDLLTLDGDLAVAPR